jgi:hypothetical protein
MLDELFSSIISKVSYSKEAEISGIKFKLKPLTFEEDQKISSYPDEGENPIVFYDKTKIKILSYSIYEINEEKIPDIIETKEGDKTVTKEKSIYLVEKLSTIPTKITDSLFDIYIDFKEEIEKKISKEIKYDWFKTPEQRDQERKDKLKNKEEEETDLKETSDTEDKKDKEDIVLKKVDIQE